MPRKFIESVANALRGLRFSLRTQRNLGIHFVFAFFAIVLGIILNISTIEMVIIIFVSSLVIVLELLNTSIEEIVNMLTLIRKMRAMVAKDVAAAAVLIASISAFLIGCLIFIPKLFNLLLRTFF